MNARTSSKTTSECGKDRKHGQPHRCAPRPTKHLKAELRATPVAALRVVADGVIRLIPEPLRNLTVLFRFLRELFLDHKRLLGRLHEVNTSFRS
jgi:hypothetical protein